MTVLDPAFEGIGQEAGMVIWRIEVSYEEKYDFELILM